MRLIGLAVVLTLSVFVTPLATEAQPSTGKVWRIGALMSLYPSDADPPLAFRQRLRTLGYVEGQNLVIEWRYAQGHDERLPGLAAQLVGLNVDLIVADTTVAVRAAMQATSTIPIVIATSADAVEGGLVSNLRRPGGNVTGNSLMLAETGVKRRQLLKEAAGLFVSQVMSPTARRQLLGFAAKSRLPTMFANSDYVPDGGLMSYSPSRPELFRQTAVYVDKILKGAKPGDLPVEQPTKFELVINLKTAKTLGLTIPQTLLQRADQIIQ